MQLHRYLFSQYLQVTLIILFSLLMIVWLNQTLQLLELVVNKGAPLIDFLLLSLLSAPLWLLQAIPIALFIGIIWVIQKVQSDREWVVMQAIGISHRQFALSPLLLGVLASLFLLLNSIYFLPASFGEFKQRQTELRNAIPRILLQDRVFVDLAPGLTIFINERISNSEVRNVFIQDARHPVNISTLTAAEGTFALDEGRPVLLLKDGERFEMQPGREAGASLFFEEYKLYFASQIASKSGKRPIDMNEDSISNLLSPETAIAKQYVPQRLAYGHYRIASPFIAITLALIAVAGLARGRLRDEYSRKRIWQTIGAAIGAQVIFFMARSITVSAPQFWPLIYLSLLVPASIALWMIIKQQPSKTQGVSA